eukprot:m.25971 g.25971  ORF g.25971 m.25971 type:complete len:1077 (+) comp6262_c0_seq1:117-3347(+)
MVLAAAVFAVATCSAPGTAGALPMRRVVAPGFVGTNWSELSLETLSALPALPTPTSVRVAVVGSSVNPVDWKIIEQRLYPGLPASFPAPLGMDMAGVVQEVGSGCPRLKAGDRVWADLAEDNLGGYSTYTVVECDHLGLVPQELSLSDAAVLPLVSMTGLAALTTAGAPWTTGPVVVVLGGSGGCGTSGIQMALAYGAATVITTTSADNFDFVRSLGATKVFDYRTQDWAKELGPNSVDVVYDTVGETGTADKAMTTLRSNGWFVTIAGALADKVPPTLHQAFIHHWMKNVTALDRIAALISAGKLKAHIQSTFALDQIPAAFAASTSGQVVGKLAINTTALRSMDLPARAGVSGATLPGSTITLNPQNKGPIYDGVGAISGGGATSKLLESYPEQQRSEILDFLFKPQHGASLQILKVEIGGDGQATEGTESSHMHTETDEAYDRGYEWWLAKEAKSRAPQTRLYGLPWTFPGWVTESGIGGTTTNGNLTAIAQVLTEKTAGYVAKWVDGAKVHHNLSVDFVGLWNEHPPTPDYAILLRRALDASVHGRDTAIVGPDWHTGKGQGNDLEPFMQAIHTNATVKAAVARVGFHYPKRLADAAETLGPLYTNFPMPVWSSEESSTTDTPAGGACWARLLNQNYVVGNMTATIMWNLITSFYTTLPYYGASLMNAGEPWSGHYEVKTPIWATAHHTQFTEAGWRYLGRGSGVGTLSGGGTVVTYASPTGDWTMVFEKILASTGPCLRDSFKNDTMSDEVLSVRVRPGLAVPSEVQTWVSDWSRGNATADTDLFQPGPILAVHVGADGVATFNVTVPVDHVLTVTSLPRSTHGNHGTPGSAVPPSAPFPPHYANDFDSAALDSDEPMLADQAGHWEVRAEGPGLSNQVLRQVCPAIGVVYRGDRLPIAVLGSPDWVHLSVRLRFRVESVTAAGIYFGVRARNKQQTPGVPAAHPLPQGTRIAGVYLALYLNGTASIANDNYALFAGSSSDTRPMVGVKSNETISLMSHSSAPLSLNVWYNLELTVRGEVLAWQYTDAQGAGGNGSQRLEPKTFPTAGQFAVGLPDYGTASIDDLNITTLE